MISVSTRIWAGILAVCLLPLTAVASDGDATAPSNKTAASETTAPPALNPAPAAALSPTTDPLLRLLATKGIMPACDLLHEFRYNFRIAEGERRGQSPA